MPTPQDKPTSPPADMPVPNHAAVVVDTSPPAAGGCYTRDPATGVLTLVTPSTIQE